ncbi:annexin D4 [Senna tora]|uniref:Annexin D4 n=1 Tax=Senna tora TaxID=362788 RepID=A0A834TND1_9FABA|nr:annexin D4 [Senna tora]
MALLEELEALTKAFSGHGVDEKSCVAILGKWEPENRKAFRKGTPHFFIEDERQFEKWDDRQVRLLKHEFMRFKNAVVLWAMHPWERDARLAKEAMVKGPHTYGLLVEIACTRTSEELLGAKKAYHSLYDRSLEEDIVSHVHGTERKQLLVALVSAYRYEGSKVKDETAKSEAKALSIAMKNANDEKPIIEDEEVIRILGTRSKPHLQAVHKHYNEISGKNLDEDLDDIMLKETVQCLCTPLRYFSKVLDAALRIDVDKNTKKALTRVIVTRADIDMKEIKDEYQNLYGISLSQKIEDTAIGNYKDFLLTLISRGG